jgi:TonB-linked SusC/RagA family outer membrane protein
MDMMVTRTEQTVPYSAGLTGSSGAVSGVGQVLGWIYSAPPTIIKKFPNKESRPAYTYYGTYGESWNPVAQLEKGGVAKSINDQALLNIRPKWTIIPGLDLKGQFSYQVTSGVSKQTRDAYIFYDYFTEQPTGRNYTDIKSAGPTNRTSYYYMGGNLDYRKSFGQHRINGIAGYSQELNNSDAWTEIALKSVFGKVYYSYQNKYLMEIGIRGDGSSLLAAGKKWGTFPSIAIGWNLAEENFMKNISFLDQFKIRASYGMLGNNNISPYLYQSAINTADGTETSNGNPDITWERLAITDIGANISLFRNKLNMTIDYYYKKTTDMILYPQPSLPSGLIAAPANVGSMQNKGIEIAASHDGKVASYFMYNVSGGISYNKSKLLKLAQSPLVTGDYIYREGGEMGEFYGYKSSGLLQEKDILGNVPLISGQKAGDIGYVDVTGDNKITDADRVPMGNTDPRLTYFANLTLYIGRFDIETLINGVGKVHLQYSSRIANPLNTAGSGGTPQDYQLDYWTPTHTNASRPRLTPTPGNNGLTSSFWIVNSAFARMRYLSLGYTFKMASSSAVKKFRAYVNAQNPFTFSSVKILDPEGKGNEGTYPIMRVFTFGVNLSL